ncbi:GldG family protein [Myxococcaceae bacterium GXIMD 01537]
MKAANLGKVLGAFGLVLLLSSPYTLFFTSGSPLVAGLKAAVGAALVGVYVATNLRHFGQSSSRRASVFFATSALWVLVVLGGLVALNVIAHQRAPRWDITQGKLHTLAPQTRATLAGLKQPVRVLGFLPPTHPQYSLLEELFRRYRAEAPESFDFSFMDPMRHPDLALKYHLRQGEATVVVSRGEGAAESHTLLSSISEEDLTHALMQLDASGAQKVYFAVGHGEWPLDESGAPGRGPTDSLAELKRQLIKEGYQPEELHLTGKTEVPRDAALVIIAGARTPYTPPEAEALRAYLAEGGRLLYFAEALMEPKLDALLAEYGVQVDPGVAADPQYNGGNPFVPVSSFYGEHDITRPLQQGRLNTTFATARGLTVLRGGVTPGVQAQSLVLTSPFGWVESTPTEDATPSDGEKAGQVTLAAVSTRDTRDAPQKRFEQARVVVVGDSELLLDANWGHEANRNLVMNALGWATQQVKRITIRPPDREGSALEMDPDMLARLRFVATDLLPLSLLGIGLAIWRSRSNK